jgi:hypothetical protein
MIYPHRVLKIQALHVENIDENEENVTQFFGMESFYVY